MTQLLSSLRDEAKKSSLFEKFANTKTLSDDICLKTTGLSKEDFIDFCTKITSLNNSCLRTKEQCLAIYLFWLKTGTKPLKLLKTNTLRLKVFFSI